MHGSLRQFSRREALRTAAVGTVSAGAAALLASCTPSPQEGATVSPETDRTSSAAAGARVLLAYFSRAGENYYYGDRRTLGVGNTAVLASMIADRIDCDVFEIKPSDPYPTDYEATVARNVREEQQDARPEIDGDLPSLDGYDAVLLGSPVWNVQTPMIMRTFVEALDLSGKTIHPFVTYAVSRMGDVRSDYRRPLPQATITEGLAVQGETVNDASGDVAGWLDSLDLPRTKRKERR